LSPSGLFLPHLAAIDNDDQLGATLGIGDELTRGGLPTRFDKAPTGGIRSAGGQRPHGPSGPTG